MIRFVLFWRRWGREKHQYGDAGDLRDAVGDFDGAVGELAGEEVSDQAVVAESDLLGELSRAVGHPSPGVIHHPSQDVWGAEVIADVQRISIGTVRLSMGTVNQIKPAASTDPNGRK
ncbi:MAG TPA: hypothetical protein VK698_39655 [Kofleriaceae bacterium]|nr:hypothetical protein [Kofleriaceae bacterium]